MPSHDSSGSAWTISQLEACFERLQEAVVLYLPVRNRNGTIVDFQVDYLNASGRGVHLAEDGQPRGKRLSDLFASGAHALVRKFALAMETQSQVTFEVNETAAGYNGEGIDMLVRVWPVGRGCVATWEGIPHAAGGAGEGGSPVFDRRIFDELFAFVAYLTVDGTLIDINEPPLRISGLDRGDVLGKKLWDQYWWGHDPATREKMQEACEQAARGERLRFDVVARIANDGRLPVDFQIAPVRGEDGSVTHLLPSGVDISEREKAQRELREKKIALQRSHSELENYVELRTTELRDRADQLTRLSSELALVEHRERRRLAQFLHDELQQILVGAKMQFNVLSRTLPETDRDLANQIKGLLDDAVHSSRTLTSELSPTILHEAGLAAGLEWLGRWMEDKHGLEVELDLDESADPERDDVQVLVFMSVRELLFNVVKHAGVNQARVQLDADGDKFLRVLVDDLGCGFDADDAMQSSGSGGYGLFSIRERLALLGGQFEVESEIGEGTRCTLFAPRDNLAGADPSYVESITGAISPIRSYTASIEAPNKIRIVLADDHDVVRQGLARLISSESSMEIVGEACDGLEAIMAAKSYRPDIVLMDFSMPRVNGVEATRRIRRDFPTVKVIGLSMYEEPDRATAMIEAGAEAYLSKSGESSVLLDKIREVGRKPA